MLITRPRRFGKTLGMNMLASFHYSVKSNREHGEKISGMNMTRSCAMALRFIRSAAWSNENQTENDT